MSRLSPYWFDLDGTVFNVRGDVVVDTFTPDGHETRAQDGDGDGDYRVFGRDRRTPSMWSWTMFTDRRDDAGALESLDRIAAAWDPELVRDTPGAVSTLRYAQAGRIRRVYGRPRRFTASPDNRSRHGYIPIVCDFARADLLHYDDAEESQVVTMGAARTVGGLVTPWKTPLRTKVGGAPQVNTLTVTTSAPTWAVVTFHGGVTDPALDVAGWRVGVTGVLAHDQDVVVDPRPWARTVTRSDGAPLNGRLTPSTRMARMLLPAGTHEAVLSCATSIGPVRATVAWRPASRSL